MARRVNGRVANQTLFIFNDEGRIVGYKNTVDGQDEVVSLGGTRLRGKQMPARMQFGRWGTMSNATAKTFNVVAALASPYCALRPISGNNDPARSYQWSVMKVSAPASLADDTAMLNNAGTWVSVTESGLTAMPMPVAQAGSTSPFRPNLWVPDFAAIASVDRTDGGRGWLAAARGYNNDTTATALPCYGDGTDDFTDWASRTDDMVWIARQLNGDGVTTPTNFTGGTSGTNQSQSPIAGFQYLPRDFTLAAAVAGDSTYEGRGAAYLGLSFLQNAVRAAAASTGVPIEFANLGYSGQSQVGGTGGINGYAARTLDYLFSDLCGDFLFYEIFSPNDEAVTLTSDGLLAQEMAANEVAMACVQRGVRFFPTNGFPANAALRPWGSSDELRANYIGRMRHRFPELIDTAGPVSGPKDGSGQVTLLLTDDDIHLSTTGNVYAPLVNAVRDRMTPSLWED